MLEILQSRCLAVWQCDALIPVAKKRLFSSPFFLLGSFQFFMHLLRVYGSVLYHSPSQSLR